MKKRFRMTLYQFNLLDKAEQSYTLWQYGVKLAEIKNKHYNLILYQIDAFYVEVWYQIKRNEIRQYVSFLTTDKLTPYLNQIDVRSVCNSI
jgi:hypothetical protein